MEAPDGGRLAPAKRGRKQRGQQVPAARNWWESDDEEAADGPGADPSGEHSMFQLPRPPASAIIPTQCLSWTQHWGLAVITRQVFELPWTPKLPWKLQQTLIAPYCRAGAAAPGQGTLAPAGSIAASPAASGVVNPDKPLSAAQQAVAAMLADAQGNAR